MEQNRSMSALKYLGLCLTTVVLVLFSACGNNSRTPAPNPSPNPTPTQAPTDLAYTVGTASYIQGIAITPNTATCSGGKVASYSVTPPLPAGLSLDASTGTISGTPIPVTTTTVYTVTAANSAGSTVTPLTITIIVAAPAGLAYSSQTAFYTVDEPIRNNAPSSTGGAPSSYTVNPQLPPGLQIAGTGNPLAGATGIISGIPTGVTATHTYRVTATNTAGSATTDLTITVNAARQSPAGLSYSAPAPVYATGVAITPNIATTSSSGGAPTSFSVNPPLPAGLVFNPQTGEITGTPAAASSATAPPVTATYTVTASNAQGSTTAPLTITLYNAPQWVPNVGQSITPLATNGSSFQFLDTGMVVADPISTQVTPTEWLAGQAVSTAVSPDGKTLLVLTSGYNRVFQAAFPLFDPQYSNEYVFIYDISNGSPVFQQSVQVPNAYHGLAWDPIIANHAFYVSGGMGDAPWGTDPIPYLQPNNGDNVHIFTQDQTTHVWSHAAELDLGQDLALGVVAGHPAANGLPVPNNQFATVNSAVFVAPCAAGLALSEDGQMLVVANYENDSITVFTGGLSIWLQQWVQNAGSAQGWAGMLQGTELDLRPGKAVDSPSPGIAGGEYPFGVAITGDGSQSTPYTAYVSSLRDREIDVISMTPNCVGQPPFCMYTPAVAARIPVKEQDDAEPSESCPASYTLVRGGRSV